MVEPIELECRVLPNAPGWASCTVRSGDSFVEIGQFSHALTEGFDDLVRATTAIVSGSRRQTFSMDDEPEPSWQWVLAQELQWGPKRFELEVTIRRIDDVVSGAGETVFLAVCDPDDFGRAVVSAMKAMMSREETASLRQRWGHFPERAIAALEAALTVRRTD